jgi:hypothetical protein
MNAMRDRDFGLATTREELLLRRRLLFRLLRGFDFNAPEFHGEMISDPFTGDARGLIWSVRR